jgi:beta-mannosidase
MTASAMPSPDAPPQSAAQNGAVPRAPSRARVAAHERTRIVEGWEAANSAAVDHEGVELPRDLRWRAASVPGTAAAALRDAGEWQWGDERDFDAEDWWFRTTFDAAAAASGEQVVLHLGGIATVADVVLNGELVHSAGSMFERHALDVGARLRGKNELVIRCRALAPLLRRQRKPRQRWRTRVVADGNLRFYRTMLLGRAPGFAPGPAAVGPWREVGIERRRGIAVERARVRTSAEREDGVLELTAELRALDGKAPVRARVQLSGPSGEHGTEVAIEVDGARALVRGELRVERVALWWPHTHGEPALHEAQLHVETDSSAHVIELGRVGFRTIAPGREATHEIERDGLDLHVNGVQVFARGAVWTPVDAVTLAPSRERLRTALEQARDAGMNILRVPGTSAYESEDFHDLCDELGVLVWQDFMFANLDYPIADEAFRAQIVREAEQVLDDLGGRPSTVVLCGNSEVEQQVAMLGLDPLLGRGELFGELLPELAREHGLDAVYVPSAPCGGDQPFRPDRGVANYYGVGGYMRPLEDARRAEVRFAAECLALSNVPAEATIEQLLPGSPGDVVVHHPRWKEGVPRDSGAGWDFEDVRDHYLRLLFGVDPAGLRRTDHERYLELSRHTSGEVMAEVLGEWRRDASPCGGGMVLWLRDLAPGAGWGLIDAHGEPKAAYHYVRRACAPVAVWMTDEGLGGIVAHVANDRPRRLDAQLRLSTYRDREHLVEEAVQPLALAPHTTGQWNAEAVLGHFADLGWAYRFGPPQQDLVIASLESPDGALISQAMRFPAGRTCDSETAARLGIDASLEMVEDGRWRARVSALRLLYGVRLHVRGFAAGEDAFSVEPRRVRTIALHQRAAEVTRPEGFLSAVNLGGRISLAINKESSPSTPTTTQGAAA